ncbi:geranylgeranylglycerol-phosphate geranylgeranyltransferase [Lacihabitans soyangensis]|uniref:geranylgeranylglycerol-phosphate geranylgeranyltransferase n=1 Tax=Lacihabitans soyangensis TaxID=869394 RepID=UPI0020CBF7C7|nr:geranylgeranylglycerol-phosphate geranylgeranyltransferase [Lacihabitans soyangensis]
MATKETYIKPFLKLIRWNNLLIIAFSQYLVRYFLIQNAEYSIFSDWRFLILVISTLFIAGGGYVINDYFDVKIDQINKPKEVFVGRIIKRRYALLMHQVFSGIGIFLGLFLGWRIFIINVFSVSILWFYASVFKKKPFSGNLIVAFLTAMSISEIAIYYEPGRIIIHIYALFAFFINLVREIIKDLEDMKGDAAHGSKTLPITLGIRKTKTIIYALLILFVVLVLILLAKLSNFNLWICFGILGILLMVMVYKLILADRKSHFAQLSRICKIIMLLGVASIVFV